MGDVGTAKLGCMVEKIISSHSGNGMVTVFSDMSILLSIIFWYDFG